MTQLSDLQLAKLKNLQKQTLVENPDLETMLNELCYINSTNEHPWGENYDFERYLEFFPNFNFNAYNQYLDLVKEFGVEV